jgi:hypothetical protein
MAGWPFWSTMRMGAAALFAWGMLARLSPDSALTKNAMANTAASQKVVRTTFDLFMIFTPSPPRQRFRILFTL